jgi:hypothetical protein
MTWVKIDDWFYDNTTNRDLGAAGRDLFIAGLCYCAKGLTDGVIAKHDLPLILAQAQAKKGTVSRLVATKRWLDRGDFYEVDEYLTYQLSRARVEADRAKEREKKRRQRGAADHDEQGRFAAPSPGGHDEPSPPGQTDLSPQGQEAMSPQGVPPGCPTVPDPTRPPTTSPPVVSRARTSPAQPQIGASQLDNGDLHITGSGRIPNFVPPEPIDDDERALGRTIAHEIREHLDRLPDTHEDRHTA